MEEFAVQNWIRVKGFAWWGMIGVRQGKHFSFWKVDRLSQPQPDLSFDAPTQSYVDSGDHYLVVADPEGTVVIYKDGNSTPIGMSNILGQNSSKRLLEIKLHDHYLMATIGKSRGKVYIYDLDRLTLNGKFKPDIETGVEYTGKYAFIDVDPGSGERRFVAIDLDTGQERELTSLPEDVEGEITPLESQGRLILHEQDELLCYDLQQDRLIWSFPLGDYQLKKVVDLRNDRFMLISYERSQPEIVYQTSTGQIITPLQLHLQEEVVRTIWIPETNRVKYLLTEEASIGDLLAGR